MKLCRVMHQGAPRWGVVEADSIVLLARAPFERVEKTAEKVTLAGAKLLAPSEPSKIVGVGLNYRAHAAEMNKPLPKSPLLFLKPPTAILDPEAAILLPGDSQEVHHEAELGVVIGKKARKVTPEAAKECILGFTCTRATSPSGARSTGRCASRGIPPTWSSTSTRW
jgi:2-keto-4-pentenoate hydratase/2-oxohepta-3-ene-1,7-dioic acid hydratase in catechol pathway